MYLELAQQWDPKSVSPVLLFLPPTWSIYAQSNNPVPPSLSHKHDTLNSIDAAEVAAINYKIRANAGDFMILKS